MPSNKPEKAREYYINYKEKLQERNKTKNYCNKCYALISPWNWSKHCKTNKHIKNTEIYEENQKVLEHNEDRAEVYEKYIM